MTEDRARREALARLEKARKEAAEARRKVEEMRARANENEERLEKAREELGKAREERKGGIGKAQQELKEAEGPEKEAARAEKKAASKKREEHLSSLRAADSHKPGEEEGCVTRCLWDKATPPSWRRRCLFKGHDHRENGVKYQLAHESDWYNLDFRDRSSAPRKRLCLYFSEAQLARRKAANNPILSMDCWWMSEDGVNFRVRNQPWDNDAHHIIPIEALSKFFGEKLLVLQAAKYNVNAGVNILLLPTQEKYGRIYQLPVHLSHHPDYNEAVKKRLDITMNNLKKRQEDQEGHPDLSDETAPAWKMELNKFSKRVRAHIRQRGLESSEAGIAIHINDVFSL